MHGVSNTRTNTSANNSAPPPKKKRKEKKSSTAGSFLLLHKHVNSQTFGYGFQPFRSTHASEKVLFEPKLTRSLKNAFLQLRILLGSQKKTQGRNIVETPGFREFCPKPKKVHFNNRPLRSWQRLPRPAAGNRRTCSPAPRVFVSKRVNIKPRKKEKMVSHQTQKGCSQSHTKRSLNCSHFARSLEAKPKITRSSHKATKPQNISRRAKHRCHGRGSCKLCFPWLWAQPH